MGNGKSKAHKELLDKGEPNGRYFGFENFGNTCYMNSVVQALYFCPAFRETVLAYDRHGKPESLLTALYDLFDSIAHHKKRSGTMRPKPFYNQLKKSNELFNSTMQQDAQEFLSYLLNTLSDIIAKEEKDKRDAAAGGAQKPAPGKKDEPPPTFIQNLFEGRLTNETRCMCCETVTDRDEAFINLQIEIAQNSSVSSCLRSFSKVERLVGDSKFACDECCSYQEAEKRMRIKKLPNVLSIQLKRFTYVERLQRLTKLSHRVVFPFELRLFNTTEDAESADQIYDLQGAVIHIGSQLTRGHYIALVKSEGVWLLLDDALVQPVDESVVSEFFGKTDAQQNASKGSDTAYILFYQARNCVIPQRPGGKGDGSSGKGKSGKHGHR